MRGKIPSRMRLFSCVLLILISCVKAEDSSVAVTGISLDRSFIELTAGESISIVATVSPNNAENKSLTWSTNNASVATVNNGTVKAVSAGKAIITVKSVDGGKTATCEVTVVPATVDVTGVRLDMETVTIVEGEIAKLTVSVLPADATNQKISWASSDETVVTVKDGVLTAIKAGTATVTVKTEDKGFTARCEVTVKAKTIPVESITLSRTEAVMTEGDEIQLKATITPENASNKVCTWSTSNAVVASVKDGKVAALKPGSAIITVTSEDGHFQAQCEVSVVRKIVSVTGISLDCQNLSLTKGENKNLVATVEPSNATNRTVVWSSSNNNVATVKDGIVTAVDAGNAKITARTLDKGYQAYCSVTVVSHVTGISLDYTDLDIDVGQSICIVPTIAPNNASNKNIRWESSNPDIVSVDNRGMISGISYGSATVTATTEDGGKSASCKVNVFNKPKQLSITPDKATLSYGESLQVTVTASPAPCRVSYKWRGEFLFESHDNVATAKITDPDFSGITYIDVEGMTANGKTLGASVLITVILHVKEVSLDKTETEIGCLGSFDLVATIAPDNATNKKLTWSVSDTRILSAYSFENNKCKVTGLAPGTATVTATTEDGNKSCSCTVKVSRPDGLDPGISDWGDDDDIGGSAN